MSFAVIHCPVCQHELRVPETLYGEAVTCPKCQGLFRAPRQNSDGTMGQAELLPSQTTAFSKPTSNQSSPLLGPGLALLLVGVTGLLANGMMLFLTIQQPEQLVDSFMQSLKDENNPVRKMLGDQEIKREQVRERVEVLKEWSTLFCVISLFALIGAICILLQRGFWFAVLGSVLGMVNPGSCCCLMGFPVGIWALVKLFDPESRVLFQKSNST